MSGRGWRSSWALEAGLTQLKRTAFLCGFALLAGTLSCAHLRLPKRQTFAAQLPVIRDDAEQLSETIGKRVAGQSGERVAAEYIAQRFVELGLEDVALQHFEFPGPEGPLSSANVVARLSGQASKGRSVVIGAHYDSAAEHEGRGASDNAVSVAVLLALAKMWVSVETELDLVFVAFGAEEAGDPGPGLHGSQHFVDALSGAERRQISLMVNLDSIVGGDHLYVYAGRGVRAWPRKRALRIARRLGIELRTSPGIHPKYPVGTTGPWSDHAAFEAVGTPFAYFEATNWDVGNLDGYAQTQAVGQIWHSDNDTLAFIDSVYPGRIDSQALDVLQLIYALLQAVAGYGAVRN